ncbi:MAG: 4-hydroxy-tetrahydrodipicolinate synthase [Faecalibacterium sp.]|nr:4-hydroxy-tetrahydrodipicolinate synthase [Faecalibacterium sp.]
MKQPVFYGSGVALVTPMHPDGSVYYEEFERLVDDQICRGSDALIVCGTTGESATLTAQEHLELFRRAVDVSHGRVPVIAGTGSNDTAHAVDLSIHAANCGVDALLLVTPYYNKTSQEGLVQHFTTIADAAQLPILLYNIPSRTGLALKEETAAVLARNQWIRGLKEASGSFAYAAELQSICDLPLYAGNDTDILAILAVGGHGVISVAANLVPELVFRLCAAWRCGDTACAKKLQLELMPLCKALFCEVNPMPIKYAMQRVGWKTGPCRLPLWELSKDKKRQIDKVLQKYELISP